MKTNSHLNAGFVRRQALSFVSAFVLASPAALFAQQYQKQISSRILVLSVHTPSIRNSKIRGASPEALAEILGGSPMQRAEFSTLYNAQGTPANPLNPGANGLVVTIPPSVPPPAIGTPNGCCFQRRCQRFSGGTAGVAQTFFLFVSLDGTISGWDTGGKSDYGHQKGLNALRVNRRDHRTDRSRAVSICSRLESRENQGL